MLDPQTLYAACRALEDATGREIVPPQISMPGGHLILSFYDSTYGNNTGPSIAELAADILEARLWRAVREWAGGFKLQGKWLVLWVGPIIIYDGHDNLPAAAHAIAEWCKGNKEKA